MDLVTDGAGVDPAMHEQFPHEQFAHKRFLGGHVVAVSAASGDGLENLCSLLAKRASELLSRGDGPMVPTRARHRLALEACGGHLARAAGSTAIELMAEDLRMAARELGRIVGIVDVEDILDVVFRELCIGK
jgi:tRNA modification GTPase